MDLLGEEGSEGEEEGEHRFSLTLVGKFRVSLELERVQLRVEAAHGEEL